MCRRRRKYFRAAGNGPHCPLVKTRRAGPYGIRRSGGWRPILLRKSSFAGIEKTEELSVRSINGLGSSSATRNRGHNKLASVANSPIPRSIRRSCPTAIRSGLGRSPREERLSLDERFVGIECRVRRTVLVSWPAVHGTFPTRDSSQ